MRISSSWSEQNIPNLCGKLVLITGGNKGLGFQSALEFARKGAKVVLTSRDLACGLAAKGRIKRLVKNAKIEVMRLDLTDNSSIADFSEEFLQKYQSLDILLCNAGVVNLDTHQLTSNGDEMHMATNHFGHFSLVGKLLPLITKTPNARIVVVTSLAYKSGEIRLDDLNWQQRKYNKFNCYGDSKLANLLFVKQLNSYLREKKTSTIAVSAHPGLTGTERQQTIGIGGKLAKWLATSVEKGVRSQLLAATDNNAKANDFYGPRFGLMGSPHKIKIDHLNAESAVNLWKVSEQKTGVYYD